MQLKGQVSRIRFLELFKVISSKNKGEGGKMWCIFIGITLPLLVIAGCQSNNIEEVELIYRLKLFPHGKNVLKKR